MPREYTPYAIIETTFILSDPRYKSLPPTSKVLYIALWARAFQDRRELLPEWYNAAAMSEDSSLDTRTVSRCVAILLQRCLIKIGGDGRVRVCGAKGKGKIKWKEDGVVKSPKKRQSKGKGRHIEEKSIEEERGVPTELCGLDLYEKDSKLCATFRDNLKAWEKAYPDIDITAEIRKAHAWEMNNPSMRKTSRARFIGNWIKNERNPVKKETPKPSHPSDTLFNATST